MREACALVGSRPSGVPAPRHLDEPAPASRVRCHRSRLLLAMARYWRAVFHPRLIIIAHFCAKGRVVGSSAVSESLFHLHHLFDLAIGRQNMPSGIAYSGTLEMLPVQLPIVARPHVDSRGSPLLVLSSLQPLAAVYSFKFIIRGSVNHARRLLPQAPRGSGRRQLRGRGIRDCASMWCSAETWMCVDMCVITMWIALPADLARQHLLRAS